MKSFKETLTFSASFILAGLLLTACGGGSTEVEGGLPGAGSGTGGAGSGAGDPGNNPPRNITISVPETDAIENLGGGIYRRRYTAAVTDKEGNAVPDGTRINLFVIDTIKATGVIDAALSDTIADVVLTDNDPYLGDGITSIPSLSEAKVNRENTSYRISAGDHLLLFNAARVDKARIISGVGTNSVTVSTGYANNYPNALYPGTGVDMIDYTFYAIGASKNGAFVEGQRGERGVAVTRNGEAEFYMVYPADIGHILNGCTDGVDLRTVPADASRTYVIATDANNLNVSTVYQTCFNAIKGGSISTQVKSIGGTDPIPVTFTLRDGGDGVALPFTALGVSIDDSGGATVTFSPDPPITDINGNATITFNIGGTAGGTATITVFNEEIEASVDIQAKAQ